DERPEEEQRDHVEGEVGQPDVDEPRRDPPPPLALARHPRRPERPPLQHRRVHDERVHGDEHVEHEQEEGGGGRVDHEGGCRRTYDQRSPWTGGRTGTPRQYRIDYPRPLLDWRGASRHSLRGGG